MQPATIKLFLVNGSPTGLRTAEISNWSGKAIACPRSNLDTLLARPELQSPGVYFLSGFDTDSSEPLIYIGEAENVVKRLKQHAKNEEKDFWVRTSVFVSKDDNLTKAHIKYIEGQLIHRAYTCQKAIVMNSASSGASLPEADQAEMDVFIDKMLQLLPVLGIQVLTEPSLSYGTALPKTDSVEQSTSGELVFMCKSKGFTAKGVRTESGFTVLRDSQLGKDCAASCPANIIKLRDKLIHKGVLELAGDSYRLTQDYEFSSPSTAGSVIRGASTNGLVSWVGPDNRKLKDYL